MTKLRAITPADFATLLADLSGVNLNGADLSGADRPQLFTNRGVTP